MTSTLLLISLLNLLALNSHLNNSTHLQQKQNHEMTTDPTKASHLLTKLKLRDEDMEAGVLSSSMGSMGSSPLSGRTIGWGV